MELESRRLSGFVKRGSPNHLIIRFEFDQRGQLDDIDRFPNKFILVVNGFGSGGGLAPNKAGAQEIIARAVK